MEWALFVKRPDELFHLEGDARDRHDIDPRSQLPLPGLPSEIPISRTYYGNEYCEALIPSPRELETCLTASLERGLLFTFVTPRVTDRHLENLKDCFDLLVKAAPGTEVVVSDWGVLLLLRRQYRNLIPVLGRILNRAHGGQESSRAKNLAFFPYRRFLWNSGVKRIEFDCPIQILGIDLGKTGLQVSVYFPYDCCIFGGSCETPRLECLSACRDALLEPGMGLELLASLRVDRLIYHSRMTS